MQRIGCKCAFERGRGCKLLGNTTKPASPQFEATASDACFLTPGFRALTIGFMKNTILIPLVAFLILGAASRGGLAQEKKAKGPERFEKDIAAYEAQDRENPPPKGQILFTGASTIRRWT